jgi:hypothetical protein
MSGISSCFDAIELINSKLGVMSRAQPRPNTELGGLPPARTCTRNDRPT